MRDPATDDEIRNALRWISEVMRTQQIPFQVVGGLAAHAYGINRRVVDVDLYGPLSTSPALLEVLASATIWGPQHYRDSSWDLVFMKLDHGRVRLEIGDSDSQPQYFAKNKNQWLAQHIHYDLSQWHTLFGVRLPVMPKAELLAYKTDLARDVDQIGVAQLMRSDWHREP